MIAGGCAEPRGNLKSLRYLDLACTSERRLRIAMNDFGSGLSTLAYRMMQNTQDKQLIVTLGKRGLVTFDRPSHDRDSVEWSGRLCSEHLPSVADRVVDSLGCSESVLTAATLALAGGAGLMQAAYLGAAAAALQIATPGVSPVEAADVQRWIQSRWELADVEDADVSPNLTISIHSGRTHEVKAV